MRNAPRSSVQTIEYMNVVMPIDRYTTYQDVKEFVALELGFLSWRNVVDSNTPAANIAFDVAIRLTEMLRNSV